MATTAEFFFHLQPNQTNDRPKEPHGFSSNRKIFSGKIYGGDFEFLWRYISKNQKMTHRWCMRG